MPDLWDSAQGQTQCLDDILYSPGDPLEIALSIYLSTRCRMNDLPNDHVDSKIEEIENLFKDMEI